MRYWFDTEFLDNGDGLLHLVSLGIVAQDGREYYAVNADCPLELANDWVREHVIPQLHRDLSIPSPTLPKQRIRDDLLAFIAVGGPEPEFWGYMVAYDWVLFCQLFGTMQAFPERWPRYCRDLRQWADFLHAPSLPAQNEGHHHALWDARWNRQAWDYLDALSRKRLTPAPSGRLRE